VKSLDADALDALAVALAPRVAALLKAEAAAEGSDRDRELATASLPRIGIELGYSPGACSSSSLFRSEPDAALRAKPKRKRKS
jgi:hypothetical protein